MKQMRRSTLLGTTYILLGMLLICFITLYATSIKENKNLESKIQNLNTTIDSQVSDNLILKQKIKNKNSRIRELKDQIIVLQKNNEKILNENTDLTNKIKKYTSTYATSSSVLYSANKFKNIGVVYWNGWKWTWYSQQVLPGGGLRIPGRHVDDNGYVCDGNNYICLASSTLPYGTVINTPFGKQGKIYDTGCATDTVDVYVDF